MRLAFSDHPRDGRGRASDNTEPLISQSRLPPELIARFAPAWDPTIEGPKRYTRHWSSHGPSDLFHSSVLRPAIAHARHSLNLALVCRAWRQALQARGDVLLVIRGGEKLALAMRKLLATPDRFAHVGHIVVDSERIEEPEEYDYGFFDEFVERRQQKKDVTTYFDGGVGLAQLLSRCPNLRTLCTYQVPPLIPCGLRFLLVQVPFSDWASLELLLSGARGLTKLSIALPRDHRVLAGQPQWSHATFGALRSLELGAATSRGHFDAKEASVLHNCPNLEHLVLSRFIFDVIEDRFSNSELGRLRQLVLANCRAFNSDALPWIPSGLQSITIQYSSRTMGNATVDRREMSGESDDADGEGPDSDELLLLADSLVAFARSPEGAALRNLKLVLTGRFVVRNRIDINGPQLLDELKMVLIEGLKDTHVELDTGEAVGRTMTPPPEGRLPGCDTRLTSQPQASPPAPPMPHARWSALQSPCGCPLCVQCTSRLTSQLPVELIEQLVPPFEVDAHWPVEPDLTGLSTLHRFHETVLQPARAYVDDLRRASQVSALWRVALENRHGRLLVLDTTKDVLKAAHLDLSRVRVVIISELAPCDEVAAMAVIDTLKTCLGLRSLYTIHPPPFIPSSLRTLAIYSALPAQPTDVLLAADQHLRSLSLRLLPRSSLPDDAFTRCLASLRHLDLGSTPMQRYAFGSNLSILAQCPRLETLTLRDVNLHGVTDELRGTVRGVKEVRLINCRTEALCGYERTLGWLPDSLEVIIVKGGENVAQTLERGLEKGELPCVRRVPISR